MSQLKGRGNSDTRPNALIRAALNFDHKLRIEVRVFTSQLIRVTSGIAHDTRFVTIFTLDFVVKTGVRVSMNP